jgi:carbamoyltransferase
MNKDKLILGIWDAHDAGVAFFNGSKILFAANEERFTRRKLELLFPVESIKKGLDYLHISPSDIKIVAFSTTDPAKVLTRMMPSLSKRYYLIRRKKVFPSAFSSFQKSFKYFYTEFKPNSISKKLSRKLITKKLGTLGIFPKTLIDVDHHTAHAYGAYMASSFKNCLIVTLDGIGDGLSGTVWKAKNGNLDLLYKQSGKHSLGIFYEHVTNLLNMRELEDEGKVMALADYSIPIPDKDNPLLSFFKIKDGVLRSKYSANRMYKELRKVLWKYPFEQFAYLAQKTLEHYALEFFKYWLKKTGMKNVVFAGGTASNIKLNNKIMLLPEVDDLFVFPHMGDGGLAFGSACFAENKLFGIKKVDFKDCFLGPSFIEKDITKALEKYSLSFQKIDPVKKGAQLIANGNIVLWVQGSMEYGPRALGHRSILTLPDSMKVKDELNLKIKKRVWYQPFCPSMLLSDAKKVFKDMKGTPNEFMTGGYFLKEKYIENLKGVMNIDGSCRPQIVLGHNSIYYNLLKELKKRTGWGIVLNTSFNLHGEPIVNTPEEALEVFVKSDVPYIIINNFLISKKENT